MDILVYSRDFVLNFIYGLPPGLTSYILRVGFLLALSSFLLFAAWVHLPWRTVFTQACVALLAITITLYMPVEFCRVAGRELLTFITLIAIGCMVYLPKKVSFCLTPRLGNQLRLKRAILCLIWSGLIVQILASI
jgi:hypothetical protein